MRSSKTAPGSPPTSSSGAARERGEMKMGDLERASGVPRSTIRAYVQMGLLRAPRRAGPRLYLFDADHLASLSRIRELRAAGHSLKAIRRRLAGTSLPRATTPARQAPQPGSRQQRREEILQVATRMFARRGYESVRLSDVAEQLGLSKAALYRYYESKEALFVECVEQIRFLVVPREDRETEGRDPSLRRRGVWRARVALERFETYSMVASFLTMVARSPDPVLAAKARDAYHAMVTDVRPDIAEAVDRGLYRAGVDLDAHCYMLFGALMGAGMRMSADASFTVDRALESYLDLMTYGTAPRP